MTRYDDEEARYDDETARYDDGRRSSGRTEAGVPEAKLPPNAPIMRN